MGVEFESRSAGVNSYFWPLSRGIRDGAYIKSNFGFEKKQTSVV